jgi:phosphoglycerol transferase MdoB-like AlkP superfamily enzyme
MNLKQFFSAFRPATQVYTVLLHRLLVAMMLMSVARVIFFAYNASFFPGITATSLLKLMWGGLRFDLTAVLYLNLPVILLMVLPLDVRFNATYQRITLWLYWVLNSVALGANLADTVYYRFTLRRTTADVFKQFANETNLPQLAVRFLVDYWYATLAWLALTALLVWLSRSYEAARPQVHNRLAHYSFSVLILPLIAWLFIGGVRGGFRHSTRPITISNAAAYVQQAAEVNIVLNTPFAIMRTLGKSKISRIQYFDEEELEKTYTPVHLPADTGAMRRYNVVIIILESFSREFVGALNRDKPGYRGYTPFLDSLLQHSLTFSHTFANGRKSIDALPAILAGIPSMEVPYVLTSFSNNKIRALGTLLHEQGYHTSFFHGAPNGSMGFDAFANLAGIKNYYGMTEYGDESDFDGVWGIWDHRFMAFYAEQLNTFKQPFLSVFFSVSSHHPFIIPREFEGRFRGGEQPILKCIEYTDYSLRQFFKKVQTAPWFNQTLFVITADHCSSNVLFPETRTAWGSAAVPIIFYRPDNSLAGMRKALAQQTDIMPSVLGYLNYNEPFVAFGRNVFANRTEPFAITWRDGYNYFEGDWMLAFNGTAPTGLYNFVANPMLTDNYLQTHAEQAEALTRKVKAFVQQYNNRMIENRLTVSVSAY